MSRPNEPQAPWEAPSEPPERSGLKILRVHGVQPAYFVVVSRRPLCIHTHWNEKRRELCGGGPLRCRGCANGVRQDWSAWIHVQDTLEGKAWALELTAEAVRRAAWAAFREAGTSIRGWLISVRRADHSKTARVVLDVREPRANGPAMPDPEDLSLLVQGLYNVSSPPEARTGPPDDGWN